MNNKKAIKRLGQVFLKNENIKKKIASLIVSEKDIFFLEIGPGWGAITKYIQSETNNYWAIEIDRALAEHLKIEYPNINILNLDFLKFDIKSTVLKDKNILLFGNIPYYICTPIFLKFLKIQEYKKGYFMVQKEFFETMKAKNKTKKYSSFSILIQSFCLLEKKFSINRINFFPKPKIDSEFIFLQKKQTDLFQYIDQYSTFLRCAFAMPRKTLINNLKKKLLNDDINKIFLSQNLHLTIRSDEIDPDKFQKIFFYAFENNFLNNLFLQ